MYPNFPVSKWLLWYGIHTFLGLEVHASWLYAYIKQVEQHGVTSTLLHSEWLYYYQVASAVTSYGLIFFLQVHMTTKVWPPIYNCTTNQMIILLPLIYLYRSEKQVMTCELWSRIFLYIYLVCGLCKYNIGSDEEGYNNWASDSRQLLICISIAPDKLNSFVFERKKSKELGVKLCVKVYYM